MSVSSGLPDYSISQRLGQRRAPLLNSAAAPLVNILGYNLP